MQTLLCQEQKLKFGPQILLERILQRNVIPLPPRGEWKATCLAFSCQAVSEFLLLTVSYFLQYTVLEQWSASDRLFEDNWRFFEEHAKQFQNTPDFTVSDLSGQIFTPAPTPLLPSTKILQLRRYPGIGENCPDFCDFARSFCDLV